MSLSWKNALPALPVLLLLAGYAGTAFGLAGNVQFVIGDVKLITRTGETRILQKGAAVDEGDRIVTADGASAQIKMIDGGFIAVRPNTSIGFDTYRYAGKEDGTENAAISLLRGGFRTITGIIGRSNKQNYLVRTETATIGIRGTDHEPMVILVPAPGQVAIAPPGTYDKVNVGVAFIRTDAGSIDIQRNQVGFAPVSRAAPVILPRIPPFYKPTPAPGPQKAKEEAKDEGKKDAQQTAAAPASAEKAAEAPAQIRDTAVVDPTASVATAPSAATTATAPAAVAPVVAVTATDATGTTVNTTTQTLTSSTGATATLTEGAFAFGASAAEDAAAAAASALSALLNSMGPTALTATAASAVSAAQPEVSSAATAASSIAALSIDSALAASNATAAAALASAAAGQVSTATTKFNANGSFADPVIAVPAFAALNAANAVLQTASGGVQTAAGTASAQNSTLTATQTAASAALATANQAMSAANSALAALTAAGIPATSTASALLTEVQTAASAAQAAAAQAQTLQNAGDFTGAQAQLAIAQQQAQVAANALAGAPQIITAVANADAALLAATSITAASTGLMSAATSAQSAGASAVSTTSTQLAAAQAQASSVQQNALLTEFNNPAVASGNFFGSFASTKPVTGGVERVIDGPSMLSANTNYVLDGGKNLVEIRNVGYDRSGLNYSAVPIDNANITFSGGTAKDQANDPNGVYYFGRWQGGQVNVKDLATTGAIAPFSDPLGSGSAHWAVGLLPGNSTLPGTIAGPINNTQQAVGTASYTLAAATHPTDSLGNVGTLNSATLTANFSSQTVDAALGLTFSSTDTANVSTRNLSIGATANRVPIDRAGFEAKSGSSYAPVITCTSTSGNCATEGYIGGLGGAFLSTASAGSTTGTVGTGVAMMYGFTPNVAAAPANQPLTDLIQGVAVLSSGAAPAVGVTNFPATAVLRHDVLWPTTQLTPGADPAVTTYLVSDKSRQSLVNNLGGTPLAPVLITAPTSNGNYLFDSSGNLVRVFSTPHVVFDLGDDVPGTSTQFAAPTPLANAQLSFGGGAASSESYYDPVTGIRLGRWTGGTVNVTDLATGNGYVESLLAPGGAARSLHWVVAPIPSSLPVTGEFHYTRINDAAGVPSFAAAPTDSYGNVGTLEAARVSADFSNMKASAGVRISMPSGAAGSLGMQNLGARFDNAPISGGGFNVSSSSSSNPAGTDNLHVGCFGPGCAPDITLPSGSVVSAYGGRLRGTFASATGNAGTADGAFLRYTFDTLYGVYAATPPAGRVVDDYVNGLVAFKQGPAILHPTSAAYPTAAPTGPVVLVATYAYDNAGNRFTTGQSYWMDKPSATNPATSTPYLVTDAAGNLLSLAEGESAMQGDDRALTLSGGTANPATPIALAIGSTASASDGTILLGWQQPTGATALTVSGLDYNGCFGTGCAANPTPRTVLADGLSWVRGPAPFPFYLPGAISGYSNSGGVVVPGNATYDLGASTVRNQSGVAGTVTSAGLTVNFNNASVGFNMAATTTEGNWTANAPNVRMNQEGAFYASYTSGSPRTISSGTSVAPTTLHDNLSVTFSGGGSTWGNIQGQLMGIGLGGAGVTYNLSSCMPLSSCPTVTASGALAFGLNSLQQPYDTLTPYQLIAFATGMNSAGQFDSEENHRIQGGFVSPHRVQTVNGFPVKVDGELTVAVTYDAPCTINCGPFVNDIPVVYAVAGATGPASIGTASLLESGYDVSTGLRWGRYGGGTIGVNDRVSGASLGTLDATTRNVHFIQTNNQSGPTVLPLTGTFNYTFVGGTAPTDSNGNVGTALTAANASLSANFSTQKVDATLSNIVVGGNTWGASATGMPISGNVFQADKKLGGGGNLTVTSTLGTSTSGSLAGVFTGATGAGVGMLYSLNHGGNSVAGGVTVSGVAAFKR